MPPPTRRELLLAVAGTAILQAAPPKPLRGIFIILATPYTTSNAVDYEDLVKQVEFLDRCGAHGMVWPQMVSEYARLTREERLRGMEVLAQASKGKSPALVLGVQGATIDEAMVYMRKAEELAPDAVISTPPSAAGSLAEVKTYFASLAAATKRPVFIQTNGGPKDIGFPVELLVSLAREFPTLANIKEELDPTLERLQKLSASRPVIRTIFSGKAGRTMLHEMPMGIDGTMPGPAYTDIYVQVWNLYQSGKRAEARDLFARLLLMINMADQIPGALLYMMKKRRVFRNVHSRLRPLKLTREQIAEIEFHFEALEPYCKV